MKTEKQIKSDHGSNQVLAGVNVLDFGWALFGALTGRYLGDHGATVVKVESANRLDTPRRVPMSVKSSVDDYDDSPWFTHLNSSKYGLQIDLKHPRAKDVINRLIAWADIINENYSPGVMNRLGFGYEQARAIKPDIIMVSNSVYGQTGPKAHRRGNDGHGATLSGLLYLTGYTNDQGPIIPNPPYGDVIVPFVSVAAVVAALDYRRRTGKGQHIDTSMVEVCSHQTTPAFLEYKANKRLGSRQGNRIAHAAPHGVFPCSGDDNWCAICVFTDQEWEAFCDVIGNPSWSRESRFTDLAERKANEDDLDQLVAEWTQTQTAQEVMSRLQAAGVPAGVVQNMQDIVDLDPQLKARNFLKQLKHPVIGEFGHLTTPYKLSKTDADVWTSPCMGQHNELVCKDFLGMSDAEFDELSAQNVFV
ncbi:CaiB/BaiF CoA transferase family protein [Thermodesulfobacteriota bacterium]